MPLLTIRSVRRENEMCFLILVKQFIDMTLVSLLRTPPHAGRSASRGEPKNVCVGARRQSAADKFQKYRYISKRIVTLFGDFER